MTVLKLDVDTPRYPARTFVRTQWLARRLGWTLVAYGLSRSQRGGWHVEIAVRQRLAPVVVVAAQAILGSHWAREAHNLMRCSSPVFASALWRTRSNVLYEGHTRRVLS